MTETENPAVVPAHVTDVDPERRQAGADLVAAARDLAHAVAVTDLEAADLVAARAALANVTATLSARTRDRALRIDFAAPARARANGEPLLLCEQNPFGVPVEVRFDGDAATAHLTVGALHEGPPDGMHGGVAAWLMDCMLGLLMQARGVRAVTAQLDTRYLLRTPLDQPLQLHSQIVDVTGRKTRAEGWIEHDGRRTVESRGLFIAIPDEGL